jgi:hypothetical protein
MLSSSPLNQVREKTSKATARHFSRVKYSLFLCPKGKLDMEGKEAGS